MSTKLLIDCTFGIEGWNGVGVEVSGNGKEDVKEI